MARMRRIAPRVDDPHIEVFKMLKRLLGEVAYIRRIGDAAEAEAERLNLPMALTKGQRIDHAPCPFDVHHLPGFDFMPVEDRRIFAAWRRLEAIVEALTQDPSGGRIVERLDPP